MNASEKLMLYGVIWIAPHMPTWIGVGSSLVYVAIAVWLLWRGR